MSDWNAAWLSDKHDWATPQVLFEELKRHWWFVLDAAASSANTKCARFLSVEEDSLAQDWSALAYDACEEASPDWYWQTLQAGCRDRHSLISAGLKPSIWLNPPYGKGIGRWVKKAHEESKQGTPAVVLTFVRSDTKWWAEWAMKAQEIWLIRGRVSFNPPDGGKPTPAPAPSCLLVFDLARAWMQVGQFIDPSSPRLTVVDLPRKDPPEAE